MIALFARLAELLSFVRFADLHDKVRDQHLASSANAEERRSRAAMWKRMDKLSRYC